MVNSKLRGQAIVMDRPVLKDVVDYWNGLRAGRIAPLRSEIDPRQLDVALENLFILERHCPGDIRFRLSGRRINEFIGREGRGLPAVALVAEASQGDLAAILADVLAQPATASVDLGVVDAVFGKLNAQMVLLPLLAEDASLTRILGCLAVTPFASVGPVVFQILASELESIGVTPEPAARSGLPGFHESAEPFEPKPRPVLVRAFAGKPILVSATSARRRPALTLVKASD